MRKIILIILPLCILYFLVGAILMWTKIVEQQSYLAGAGIVGGIASVLGLLSFLSPVLTRYDIQNIEVESLQKLSDVSAEIKKLEEDRSQTASQISNLKNRKKEMELLVRKASMSLFLKEQYEHHKKIILNYLDKEPDVFSSINDLSAIDKKLTALEEEIEKDENVELLREIIRAAKTSPSLLDSAIPNAPRIIRFFLIVFRAYVQMVRRAFLN